MPVKRNSTAIGRVKCMVSNCYYNDGGSRCMADAIEIKHPNARDSESTDCATFMRRS